MMPIDKAICIKAIAEIRLLQSFRPQETKKTFLEEPQPFLDFLDLFFLVCFLFIALGASNNFILVLFPLNFLLGGNWFI